MKKIVAIFALAVLLAPCFVFADGGMISFDPYSDRWDFAAETNQQAFINYENGTEKMILSVGVGGLNEGKTMWIFPVPADPSKVAADVVSSLPSFRGEDISKKAQSNLEAVKKLLQATQLYTLPSTLLSGKSMIGTSTSYSNGLPAGASLGGSFQSALQPDVVVYEHIEKEGITAEIVTARTVQGFDDYFSEKNLRIDSTSIPVLQGYIGKEYSFVVSWINAPNSPMTGTTQNSLSVTHSVGNDFVARKYNTSQKGVFVSFPTDKIFFPLMPTSVYGSKIVPAEIRVMGHVTPDVFLDIKSFTKTGYYLDESFRPDKSLLAFYNGPATGVKYTKIEINAPSKFFTEDLWMKNSVPVKTFFQSFIATQTAFSTVFIIVLCSVLAGLLTGWLLFKEWRNREGMKKFGLIGLANCLTILGTIVLILPAKTVKDSEDMDVLIQCFKEKGYFWKRRILLFIMIADSPFLLFSLLILFYGFFEIQSSSFMLILLIPIIIFLAAASWAKAIKIKGVCLFDELRIRNYSSWTFQPKDRRKFLFVILYSVIFLITSWIVIRLLMFSVVSNIISSGSP